MVVKEKEKILEAINKTINEKGLIFLRHHNDGDGYSAGLIAETILRKLTNLNRKQISFFSYNYTFMLKDLEEIQKLKKIKGDRKVLFIIMDISMSKETLLSLKVLKKKANAEILVIDHHLIDDKELFEEIVDYAYTNLNKNTGYLSYELFFSFLRKYNVKLDSDELAFVGFLRYLSVVSDYYYHLKEYLDSKLPKNIVKKNEDLFLLFEKIIGESKGLNKSLEEFMFIFKNYELFKEDIKFLKEKLNNKVKKAKSVLKREDNFLILDLEEIENFKEFPNPKIYLNLIWEENKILIAYTERLIILRSYSNKIDFRPLLIKMKKKGIIGGAHKSRASFEIPKKKLNVILEEIKNYLKNELKKI
jgi:single-stranded DNA-specific DHH superfamily exonuclease